MMGTIIAHGGHNSRLLPYHTVLYTKVLSRLIYTDMYKRMKTKISMAMNHPAFDSYHQTAVYRHISML